MNDEKSEILKALIFIPFILIGVSLFAYSLINQDKALTDYDRRTEVYNEFEKELKEIKTPRATAENRTEKTGGSGKPIVVRRIYRSELPKNEVLEYFNDTLQKRGWKVSGRNEREGKYTYCKGKFQAALDSSSGKFGDNANYLSLSFSFGQTTNCKY